MGKDFRTSSVSETNLLLSLILTVYTALKQIAHFQKSYRITNNTTANMCILSVILYPTSFIFLPNSLKSGGVPHSVVSDSFETPDYSLPGSSVPQFSGKKAFGDKRVPSQGS